MSDEQLLVVAGAVDHKLGVREIDAYVDGVDECVEKYTARRGQKRRIEAVATR